MSEFKSCKGPSRSPWGEVDSRREQAPGIVFVGTPSHGGFWLSKARLKAMAAKYNGALARYHGADNKEAAFFEEDCEWAKVAIAFPEVFDQKSIDAAWNTLKNWDPYIWEAVTGQKLKPGESNCRDEEIFKAQNIDNYVVSTAWGDWEPSTPKGFVKVCARRARDLSERYFLIPADDYSQRGRVSLVVDLERHAACEPPR